MTHATTAMPVRRHLLAALAIGGAALGLAACGGGGGNPGACSGSAEVCNPQPGATAPPAAPPPAAGGTAPAAIPASSSVANICTPAGEKSFVRAYLDEKYLWYREIPAVDAAAAPSVPAYFNSLLVRTPDANGLPKDRFSFVTTLASADSLATGAGFAYGLRLETDAATPPLTRIAYVVPGSPAAAAGLARGGVVVQVTAASPNSWYPDIAGATISFSYRDTPAQAPRNVTLTTAALQEDPVPLATSLVSPGGRRVGYLQFNEHTESAQARLIATIGNLRSNGIDDLVLDMRYNGGGFLYAAASLASMVTSPASEGRTFERLQFNDKRDAESAASEFPFSSRVLFSQTGPAEGAPLPQLGLPRVYLLTSGGTCSASESLINGLRGIDVQVVLIGRATCGKPYGFSRKDNCALAFYPIEFGGVNAKGSGGYTAGFAPTCTVPDDFDRALGNPAERQLAAALYHADTGSCPAGTAGGQSQPAKAGLPRGTSDGGQPDIGRPGMPGKLLAR